jgi:hypothetical protein
VTAYDRLSVAQDIREGHPQFAATLSAFRCTSAVTATAFYMSANRKCGGKYKRKWKFSIKESGNLV